MKVLYCGIDFPHMLGEFCMRRRFDYYGIFSFQTPFLYESDGVLKKGEAGDILIIKPLDIVYHGPLNDDEAFVNDWMYISKDFGMLLEKFGLPTGSIIRVGRQKIVRSAIKKISDEQSLKHTGYEDIIVCVLTEMVVEISRLYQKTTVETSRSIIEWVRDIFAQNLNKKWSIEDMAKLSGYSVSRFCSLYNDIFGCSPKEDLINERINHAKQMLKFGDISISEIADACGFNSLFYFSKYFKKRTGVSPKHYREKFLD